MALLRNDAGGSECALNTEQRQQLTDYLQSHLCLTAKQVAHYVQQTWQISYSERGITQLLHRLGFVYKKPKLIPGKADAERQHAFIRRSCCRHSNHACRRRIAKWRRWRLRNRRYACHLHSNSKCRFAPLPYRHC